MDNIVRVVEPSLMLDAPRTNLVYQGSKLNNWQKFISSSYSDDVLTFTTNPPNSSTIIDTHVYLGIPVYVNITGDSGADNIPLVNWGYTEGFRSIPIHSCMSSTQCQINNETVTLVPYQYFPEVAHIGFTDDDYYGNFSSFPSTRDYFQSYTEGLDTMFNPLSGIEGSVRGVSMNRGCFPVKIHENTRTRFRLLAYIIEPIFSPPFRVGRNEGPGFVGIQNLTWTFNMTNLNRMICSAQTGGAFTNNNVTVTIVQPPPADGWPGLDTPDTFPTMFFNWITPFRNQSIPQTLTYPSFTIQHYITNIGVIPANSTKGDNTSNNIQFKFVPSTLYIYARRRNIDRTVFTTDTMAVINNINIRWDNQTGVLANATQRDLYLMSKKNGLNISYPEFIARQNRYGSVGGGSMNPVSKYTGYGSMLLLKMGIDVSLAEGVAPGMDGTFNFQFSITLSNPTAADINYDLYIIALTDGALVISNNLASSKIGLITQMQAQNLDSYPALGYDKARQIMGSGGTFTSSFLNVAERALPLVSSIAELAGLGFDGGCMGNKDCGKKNCNDKEKSGAALMSEPLLKRRRLNNK